MSVGAVYDADIGQNPPTPYVGCISTLSCTGFTTNCPCSSGNCYIDSTTAADQVTTYSNSSSTLALFAPSNNAYTTDIVGTGGYSSGDYATSFGGTSAACPYAAGAAAVLQHAARSKKGSYLTPDEVQQYLVTYGDDVTDSKPTPAITKPRVNLGAAVDAIPSVHLIIPPVLHPLILSD
jgi:subtilisin family serine protease